MNPLFWTLSAKNLLRNRRRTFATSLAVIFGFVGLVLLSAYIFRAYMGLRTAAVYLNQKAHIAIMKRDALTQFPAKPKHYILDKEDQEKIANVLQPFLNQIEFTSSFLSGTGLLNVGERAAPVAVLGLEPAKYKLMLHHPMMRLWAPDWLVDTSDDLTDALIRDPHGISITPLLARALDIDGRDQDKDVQLVTKTLDGDLGVTDATIRAHHTTGLQLLEETSVIAPLPLVQEWLATDGTEYVGIFLKDIGDTRLIAKKLKKNLGENFDVWQYDDETWSPMFVGNMSFLAVMGILFVILILGAVALSLVNTTTLNLLERTRELGTLRAIGFKPSHLLQIFRRETFLLTVFSLAIGFVLAAGIATVVNGLNIRFKPPGTQSDVQFILSLNVWAILIMAVLILLITMVASDYVVRRKNVARVITLLTDSGG